MCGIFGYVGNETLNPSPVLKALHHRGPNSHGVWRGNIVYHQICLIHTRLSILDLSTAGHQPMIDPDTGNVLIFNGEIYNFQELRRMLQSQGIQFQSLTDTEVLLFGYRVWGSEIIHKIEGMFAFILFDAHHQKIFIARDHIGIKPLYYAYTKNRGIVFGSEVRALIACGLVETTHNHHAITDYLCYGSFQEPNTLREFIHCFPPAHYTWMNLSAQPLERLSFQIYWDITSIAHPVSSAPLNIVHHQALQTSLDQQLISDVPVGLFLSAGVDSTLLAALLAAKDKHHLTAFTFAIDSPTEDESFLAALTAQTFNIKHHVVRGTTQQIGEWIIDGFKAMDQPSSDGLNTYLISRAAASQGITVVLSGCGADELHGGYAHFQQLSQIYHLKRLLSFLPSPILKTILQLIVTGQEKVFKDRLQSLLEGVDSPRKLIQEKRRYFTSNQIHTLYPFSRHSSTSGIDINDFSIEDLDIKSQISILEITGYLRNTLLKDSDWATMANHQELRVPYLGKTYIETVFQFPWSTKSPARKPKNLLTCQIPRELQFILRRPKTGFTVDYGWYLKTSMRDFAENALKCLNEDYGFQINLTRFQQDLELGMPAKLYRRYWSLVSLGSYLERHG